MTSNMKSTMICIDRSLTICIFDQRTHVKTCVFLRSFHPHRTIKHLKLPALHHPFSTRNRPQTPSHAMKSCAIKSCAIVSHAIKSHAILSYAISYCPIQPLVRPQGRAKNGLFDKRQPFQKPSHVVSFG